MNKETMMSMRKNTIAKKINIRMKSYPSDLKGVKGADTVPLIRKFRKF